MKPFISILVFITLCNITYAQKIRFTDSGNHWVSRIVAGMDPVTRSGRYVSYAKDTVLHAATYRTVVNGGPFINYWVREDTVARKVYYRNPLLDTFEHLLYDYNLQPGDSIAYLTSSYPIIIVDSVMSVDSTLIGGVYYKVFAMKNKAYLNNTHPRKYTVIEGVGCTVSPLFPAWFDGCLEYDEKLLCFSRDSVMPVITAPFLMCFSGSTDSFRNGANNCSPLFADHITEQESLVSIFPNPADDHLNITLTGGFGSDGALSVFEITGRRIHYEQIPEHTNQVVINTAHLAGGVYVIVIQDNSGILKRERIFIRK